MGTPSPEKWPEVGVPLSLQWLSCTHQLCMADQPPQCRAYLMAAAAACRQLALSCSGLQWQLVTFMQHTTFSSRYAPGWAFRELLQHTLPVV